MLIHGQILQKKHYKFIKMAKLDILLLGSYGQSNLGDDALLFSYLKFFIHIMLINY